MENNFHLKTTWTTSLQLQETTYYKKTTIFDKGNLDSPGTIIKATGNLENLRGSYNYQFTGQTSKLILEFEF